MVTYGNFTYCDDHFEMYGNIKSPCCITETNIVLQVNYALKTKKQTQKKRSDLSLLEVEGLGGEKEKLAESSQNVQIK